MSDIHKLFLYFYRNSDIENNSSLFKTYAVDLSKTYKIKGFSTCTFFVYKHLYTYT